MIRVLLTLVATLAAMAAPAPAAPALAQTNPLVGDWLSTFMDPRGITNYLYHARFGADGTLTVQAAVSGSGGSGQFMSLNRYRLTGPSSYEGTVTDYQPRQLPPFLGAPGTTFNCRFEFESPLVMDVQCGAGAPIRYTRQR